MNSSIKNGNKVPLFFLFFLIVFLGPLEEVKAQNLIHNFEFNGNLNDSRSTGISLTEFNTASSSFQSNPNGWTWTQSSNPGGGLELSTSSLPDPQAYSLGFRIEFDNTGNPNGTSKSYRKIISFNDSDNGLYFNHQNLQFFPFGASKAITYLPNTFYDFVLIRTSNDKIIVYIVEGDGTVTKVYEEDDPNDQTVPIEVNGNRRFRFFMDENQGPEHTNGGTVTGIRMWNAPLGPDEIGAALSSVTTGDPSIVADNLAIVEGSINPQGSNTNFTVEYGTTQSLGSSVNMIPASSAGSAEINTSATLPNLSPSTLYYYRVKASNVSGESLGSIKSFTTLSDDIDGDGVVNSLDQDDDNDGILDVDEGLGVFTPQNPQSTVSYTISQVAANGPTISSPSSGYAITNNNSPGVFSFSAVAPGESGTGSGTGTISRVNIRANYAPGEIASNVDVSLTTGAFDDGLYIEVDGVEIVNFNESDYSGNQAFSDKFNSGSNWTPWNNTGNPALELDLINQEVRLMVDVTDGTSPSRQDALALLPNAKPNAVPAVNFSQGVTIGTAFQNNNGAGSIGSQTLTFRADIKSNNPPPVGNIWSFYSLDSDGDGCNDVIEAGFSDPDGDGQLGPAALTVDPNTGRVTSGTDGYTTPRDGDGNGVKDFKEVTSDIAISNQPPSTQTIFETQDATIAVQASGTGNQYQWQVSTDNGVTFTDLSDDSDYNNVNTNTLTFLSVEASQNNYQYRVLVTNGTRLCQVLTSNATTITADTSGPGGVVGANLWMRADLGVTTNGGLITAWKDQEAINNFTISGGGPSFTPIGLNFNPVINFDGNNDLLLGDQEIKFQNVYAVYKRDTDSNTDPLIGMQTPFVAFMLGGKQLITSRSEVGGAIIARSPVEIGTTTARLVNVSIPSNGVINDFYTSIDGDVVTTQALIPGALTPFTGLPIIGGTNSVGSNIFDGKLAELIMFPTSHSANDRLKIQSYLALKYGLTLNRSVGQYLASNGSIIWSDTNYWNDVFGIGRDDVSKLTQVNSNSVNSGSSTGTGQSGKGNIVLTNPSSLDDGDFLMIGHNNGRLETKRSSALNGWGEIKRNWKVNRTGDPGHVSLSFDLSAIPVVGDSVDDYLLFVDTDGDGDFTSGLRQEKPKALSGNALLWNAVDLPDGAVFTIAEKLPRTGNSLNANRIIVNPSFETGSGIPHNDFAILESQIGDAPTIDGWYSTHPTYNNAEGAIEHWRTGYQGTSAQDGDYFVELNANQSSRLYQYVYLVNGETFDWRYYHRKRVASATEQLRFSVYDAAGNNVVKQIDDHSASNTSSWDERSGNIVWDLPTGFYQIGFESVQAGASGNFLDNITIGMQAFTEFARDTVRLTEGQSIAPYIYVNGQVDRSSSFTVQVDGGGAVEGTDYRFNNRTVNVPIGKYSLADSLAISFEIIDNNIPQNERIIELSILRTSGDVDERDANADGIYQRTMVIVIQDDDPCKSAGTDTTYSTCASTASTLNLLSLLGGSPDTGGTWSEPVTTSGVDLNNPTQVNFSNVGLGTYSFAYTRPANGICPETFSTLNINIREPFPAGEDNTVEVCNDGTPLNLFTSISGSPQAGGNWTEVSSSGVDISDPTSVSFTNIAAARYQFLYTLPNNIECNGQPASALITVNVTATPNSGTPATVNVCDGGASTSLDFSVLLVGADKGGTWSETSTVASGVNLNDDTNVDFDGVAAGKYTFDYTVAGTSACGNSTTTLTVNVNQDHNAGTNEVTTVCNDSGTVNLFASLGGTPDAGGTWTDIDGANVSLKRITAVSFKGVTSGTYRFTYSFKGVGVCNDVSATVSVTVTQAARAGRDATVNVCDGGASTVLNLFNTLQGTPDAGGAWSETSSTSSGVTVGDGSAVNFAGVSAGRYQFTYTVTGNNPCGNDTAVVTVNVNQPHNAGIPTTVTVCNKESSFDLLANLSGSPDPGGNWTLAGSGAVTDVVDFTGLATGDYVYTYTIPGDPGSACGDVSSTLTVRLVKPANPGLDKNVNICIDNQPGLNLFKSLGGNPDSGGQWIDLDNAGVTIDQNDSTSFAGKADGAYRFEFLISDPSQCSPASSTLTVNVTSIVDMGPDQSYIVCNDGSTLNLLDYGTGIRNTPDRIVVLGATGIDTSDPTNISFENAVFNGISARVTFILLGPKNAICAGSGRSLDNARITVTLNRVADAGLANTVNVCDGGASTSLDLFSLLRGTPQTGGTWQEFVQNSGDAFSGVSLTNPSNVDFVGVAAGKYFFRYTVAKRASCSDDASAVITVNVNQDHDAGADATLAVCNDASLTYDLFASLGGTPEAGGMWLDDDNTGIDLTDPSLVNFGGFAAGDYNFTYSIAGEGVCNTVSSTLTVTVTRAPDAGQDNTVSVCDGGQSTSVNLFASLLGTPDAGGTWSEVTSSGVNITDPSSVDFNAIPAGRYEFQYVVSGSGPCAAQTASVVVNVNQVATMGTASAIQACPGVVRVDLFSGIVGTYDRGGSWTDNSNTGVDLTDPTKVDINSLSPGTYNFTYTVKGSGVCADASVTIPLTINAPVSAGTNTVIEVCNGTNLSIVDIFAAIPGNPTPGGTFYDVDGLGVDFSDPSQIDFTGVPTGAYQVYYSIVQQGFCGTVSNLITINVNQSPALAVIPRTNICNDELGELDFNALVNIAGGSWSDDNNSGVDLTDLSAVSFENIAPGIYNFSYTIASNGICGAVTGTTRVEVFQGLDAGIDSSAEICADGTTLNLFAALGGTPDAGGIWNNKDGAKVVLNDPTAVDFRNVKAGTYRFGYSVLASGNGPCTSKSSVLTVTVNAIPNAGPDVRVSICVDPSGTTVNLLNYVGSNATSGGTWTDGSSSGVELSDPAAVDISALIDGNYNFIYTVTGGGSCGDDSATVILDTHVLPNAGTSSTLTVCNDGSTLDLFASIGNDADLGGQWKDLDGAKVGLNNGASVNFNKVKAGQYRFEYTVQGLGACTDISSIVTVEVEERPNAGFSASVSVCDGGASTVVDLFSSLQGNPATGGSWAETSTNASGVDLTDPSAVDFNGIPAGRYVFTYTVASNGNCSDAVSEVIVSVNQDQNAGVDTTVLVCQDTPVDLTTLLNGAPDPGGRWLDVNNTGIDLSDPRAVDLSSVAVGTYSIKYVLVGNGSCNDVSSILTLDVKPATDAGISASAQACAAPGSTFNLFAALAGTPDAGGSWTDDDASGLDITNPSNVDLSNITTGVYHFTYTVTGDCTTKSAIVALTVANTTSAGADNTVAVCNDGTSVNLFTSLGGSPDIGGVWTDLDNASISLSDPSNVNFNTVASGVYRFAYELAGNGACTASRAVVTVTVSDAVSAGRSAAVTTCNQLGANNIDLFALLGAEADNGGTWADLSASGVNIADPSNVDFDGVAEGFYRYEYTVSGPGTCSDSKAQITVHVVSAHTAGTGGTVNVTNDGIKVDLTAQITNGNPGGNWTDINGVGVNLSDPTAMSFANIAAGSYVFSYEIPANGACASSSTTVTVNVLNAANAGQNTTISLCSDDASNLNLFNLMNGNPSSTGTWNPVGFKVKNFNPTNVDLSKQKSSTYLFNYIVQNPGSIDKASLTIELSERGNAGIGNTSATEIVTCNSGSDPIDLFSILSGTPDLDGVWSDAIGPSSIDVSNPRAVDFTGATAGFYEFQYEVLSDGSCNASFARVYIEVEDGANAGNSTVIELCNGDSNSVDLFAQLTGNPDAGGTWTDPNGSPVTGADAVSFFGLPAGSYVFTYTIQPTGSCTNPVSSSVTVNVQKQANTGIDNRILLSFRDSPIINLFESLGGNPDRGGQWFDDSGTGLNISDPNSVDFSGIADGVYSFRYRIDDQNQCDIVEAVLTVEINFVAVSEQDTQVIEGFSPDGDGINDFWTIENIDQFPRNSVKVFNRWGHVVFEMKSYNNTGRVFDGFANAGIVIGNKPLPTGTYFYIIDFGDGSTLKKGFLTILR